jgi:parallel beta-helix repeat protein
LSLDGPLNILKFEFSGALMKQRTLQFVLLVTIAVAGVNRDTAAKTAALPACAASIGVCGCTITKAGTYRVTADLTGVAAQDCIDISATKVNLRTDGHAITGTGSGVGINIMKSASSANVQLADPSNPATVSAVSSFTTGIEVQGSGAIVSGGPIPDSGGFDVSGNSGDGLVIKGASNCSVINFTSNNSTSGNGVTINGGSNCQFIAFTASGNTGYGVEMTNAKGNTLENFAVDDSSGAGNGLGGIALISSSSNTLTNGSASGNTDTNIMLTNSSKNVVAGNVEADASTSGSGIVLTNSSSNSIFDFGALDNAVYGVWLQGSSSNAVRLIFAQGNAVAGVYLGCSPTAPGNSDCPAKAKTSSKNTVTAIVVGNDSSTPQLFGVAVDSGDLLNNLSGITATGDLSQDLDDLNANCGTNVWFANAGTIPNPACTAP